MVAMVVLSLNIAFAPQPAANRHVRSTLPSLAALLEEATSESETFAGLIAQLDASDVIVHVEPNVRLSTGLGGATNHNITTRGRVRYVRVAINPQRSRERLIGLIAHELQHALEIARDPAVISESDAVSLFQRIGFKNPGGWYETETAREIERRVIEEALAHRRSR